MSSSKLLFRVGIGIGVTAISGLSYLLYKYWTYDPMPESWRCIGTLEDLYMYPVKSCGPIKLQPDEEVACEVLGLRLGSCRDKALMLVNSKHEIVTARAYPKMVLIKPKLVDGTKLQLSAPDMETIELNFATLAAEEPGICIRTSIFGAKVNAMQCGEKYDKWFSKYILGAESGLHLVYYPYKGPKKPIDKDMVNEPFIIPADTGAFTDATSYMIMNFDSIEELNKHTVVDPLQFRGNFYLRARSYWPFAEDEWTWIKIGDTAVFRVVAPCIRCILPNINPTTGERHPDGEPLRSLKKFRVFGKNTNPSFGVHMGLRQAGTIKANDPIYVGDVLKSWE